MPFHRPNATLLVPDGTEGEEAFRRTTHMGIGAHHDDLEFFAFHGIEACYGRQDKWFTGITCTDGAGSVRMGPYGTHTDEEMASVRVKEQNKAAVVGEYAAMVQLGYSSSEIKDASNTDPVDDIESVLRDARPEELYLHNPADKHDTHIAVLLRSLEAVRRLPLELRPLKTWGCEIWRGLDWLVDADKGMLPVSSRPNLQGALNGIFDSQITGGKRYDLAVMGRRLANAIFHESHAADEEAGVTWAIDLSPVVRDDSIDIVDYTIGFIDRLRNDVGERLKRLM